MLFSQHTIENTINMLLVLAPWARDPSTPSVWLLTDNYMEVQDWIMRVQTWTQTSWVNIYTKHDLRSHCITSCLIEDRWHYYAPYRRHYTPHRWNYTPPRWNYTPPRQYYTPPRWNYTPHRRNYTPHRRNYTPHR